MQADGSDRRLKFMRDRVNKIIVLFVAANLTQQKNCIENQPGGDGAEEDNAQEKL